MFNIKMWKEGHAVNICLLPCRLDVLLVGCLNVIYVYSRASNFVCW